MSGKKIYIKTFVGGIKDAKDANFFDERVNKWVESQENIYVIDISFQSSMIPENSYSIECIRNWAHVKYQKLQKRDVLTEKTK